MSCQVAEGCGSEHGKKHRDVLFEDKKWRSLRVGLQGSSSAECPWLFD